MLFFPKNELNGTSYVQDCSDNFTANATDISSPELAVMPTRNMIRESRDYSKKSLDVQECCACVAKPIVATIERVTSITSVARESIKELSNTTRWTHVKISQGVTRGSQRYFNQKRISNDSA